MNRFYAFVSVALISVMGTSASAETIGKEGWYVAFSPYWHTGTSVDEYAGISFAETKFKNGLGLLLALGRRFEGNIGVELEASYRKGKDPVISYISGDIVQGFDAEMYSVMLNGLYYVPGVIDFAQPYFGAGIGITRGNFAAGSGSAATGQVITGLSIPINDSFSTRVGYRYLKTGKFGTGHTIDYKSHNFEVGIIYSF